MAFVHLHNHTEYSLLDGATKVYDMVKRAADLGMPAVAITDHGVMSGVPELADACDKVKAETGAWVKPIFGCEIYFTTDSSLKKEGKQKLHHMILLAKNNTGYHNIVKLVSESHVDNFYYRPRTTFEMLEKYSEGVIATSACIAGIIPRCVDAGKIDEAIEWAKKLSALYEPGDFYIELQDQGITSDAGKTQRELNQQLTEIANHLGLKTIATNDFHYLVQEDAQAQDVMLCIGTNQTINQEKRFKFPNDQFYMKTEEEMRAALKDFPRPAITPSKWPRNATSSSSATPFCRSSRCPKGRPRNRGSASACRKAWSSATATPFLSTCRSRPTTRCRSSSIRASRRTS